MNLNNKKVKERKVELSLHEKSLDDRHEEDETYELSESEEIECGLYDPDYREYLSG